MWSLLNNQCVFSYFFRLTQDVKGIDAVTHSTSDTKMCFNTLTASAPNRKKKPIPAVPERWNTNNINYTNNYNRKKTTPTKTTITTTMATPTKTIITNINNYINK